ncbi:hypothetical protein EUZ95_01710 [Enterococcus durans]|nr:hypothetical protein C9423_05500 [Lactobacillus sp. Koumiss]RSL37573.1 hypothetical protein B7758_01425 [Enterococcus durans]RXE79419.1 hypothetical protein EIA52_07355 [Enterococcus durans]TBX35750.1 hypothetical protein EUZ95_01710 [Enterococcus durans]HCB28379.1 hypothetical protein [Enterococcus sp.]
MYRLFFSLKLPHFLLQYMLFYCNRFLMFFANILLKTLYFKFFSYFFLTITHNYLKIGKITGYPYKI